MDVRQQVNAAMEERARQQQEIRWAEFVNGYGLNLLFPATVMSSDSNKKLKTNKDTNNEPNSKKPFGEKLRTNKLELKHKLGAQAGTQQTPATEMQLRKQSIAAR